MAYQSTNTETVKSTIAEREAVYGSPILMQQFVSAHWTAILRAHYQDPNFPTIPPHLVGLMLSALKIHRAACPFPKKDADSYIDGHAYLDFAQSADPSLISARSSQDATVSLPVRPSN